MSFRPFQIIFFSFIIVSGCGIKRNNIYDHSITKAKIPVFIELPQSDLVFENISPLIYDIFIEHFERMGYNSVTMPTEGYTIRIIIKRLEPIYKYISPDIVLFNTAIRLELQVTLLNYKKDIAAQKDFTFTTLISQPHSPILNSDFLEFEYARLLKKAVPKIEQYFRSFLLKSAD